MKIVVLDKSNMGDDLDFSCLSEFGELKIYDNSAPDEIPKRLRDADVAVVNKLPMNGKTLFGTDVKLICEFATGYDNIDIDFCKEAGIAVSNAVNYSTDSVAQITAATVLALYSKLFLFDKTVKAGEYSRGTSANMLTPQYSEISGKTWGIVGYGNIGKSVGKIAKALGCRVIAYKKHKTEEKDALIVSLDTLLSESDIISLHTPLNSDTRNMIGEREVSLMKKGVVIVNEARGGVWDESVMADALLDGRIAALGADVYTREPMPLDHPFSRLLQCENVILTPHMAWAAFEARVRCIDETVKNIRAFISDERRNRIV
ncbi:MAG: NAD(P)-dependent oxidoreductase [Eubacteriales bacterium]|nr:NAD(P)-dependent oxidoreductase [Eubacteriales bacterium]